MTSLTALARALGCLGGRPSFFLSFTLLSCFWDGEEGVRVP